MWREDFSVSKVLFVTNDFGPRAGGIETFITGLIERLPKGSVIVYTSTQAVSPEIIRSYDEKWQRDFGAIVIRDRAKILLPTPRVGFNLAKLVRQYSPETACFGAAAPLGLLAPALRRAGIKRIVSLTHGHEVWWAKVFPFSLALHRIGSSIDALTFLGEFTRAAIAAAVSPKAAAAMVKIAPGIDIEHFSPSSEGVTSRSLPEDLGLADKQLIVSVGRLVHRKGQDRLIVSLPLVQKKFPSAHLLLIGQGPYLEKLQSRARKFGVEAAVTFIGRVQYADLPAYIRAADIFAMPSRSRFFGLEVEGLGIVYLEASACALPVIAGKSGGAPDAVIEGVTGLVVDGTQVVEIAQAICLLLADPDRARAMGAAGRAWILEEWSWENWSAKFRQLLAI